MRRYPAAVVVMVAVAVLVGPLVGPAAAGDRAAEAADPPEAVDYRPPVDAPLTDTFRPPANRYGAGNRGVDYATDQGQAVVAAAAGEVVFAGRVGADLHVVVLHADGVRTGYSFLATVTVRRGDRVEAGDVVGTAGAGGLHFGARSGDSYVDPLALLGLRTGRVRLVADPDEARPLAEVHEKRGLVESLRGVGRAVGRGGGAAFRAIKEVVGDEVSQRLDLALVLIHDAVSLGLPAPVHLAVAALAWEDDQGGCTPPEVAVPRPPPGRRIVVLVGGLGSSTGRSAVLDVRTDLLGYAAGDVHQFSYRREGHPYRPADTGGDIAAAGRLLAEQVARLRRAHPDAAVDIIGHSMGGLVARAAITGGVAGVAVVITLGTPHQGADLATAAMALDSTTSGHAVSEGVGRAGLGPVEPNAASILQMAETSDFLARLPEDGWAPGTRVVSVAGRWDMFVPNTHSRLRDASNVVVSPGGRPRIDDHRRLPGSAEATREIGLALAGLGPTCRAVAQAFQDWSSAHSVTMITDGLSAGLAASGLWLDARARAVLLEAVRAVARRAPGR